MKKISLLFVLFELLVLCGVTNAVAQTVLTEQQLQEKIMANKRILDMYLMDAGITGVELDQYGSHPNQFLVSGPYEKIPS